MKKQQTQTTAIIITLHLLWRRSHLSDFVSPGRIVMIDIIDVAKQVRTTIFNARPETYHYSYKVITK